jgi:hypothetical protein
MYSIAKESLTIPCWWEVAIFHQGGGLCYSHYGIFSMAVDLQFFPLVCANSSILAHEFPAHNKNRRKKKIWDTSIFEGCVEILKTLFMVF